LELRCHFWETHRRSHYEEKKENMSPMFYLALIYMRAAWRITSRVSRESICSGGGDAVKSGG